MLFSQVSKHGWNFQVLDSQEEVVGVLAREQVLRCFRDFAVPVQVNLDGQSVSWDVRPSEGYSHVKQYLLDFPQTAGEWWLATTTYDEVSLICPMPQGEQYVLLHRPLHNWWAGWKVFEVSTGAPLLLNEEELSFDGIPFMHPTNTWAKEGVQLAHRQVWRAEINGEMCRLKEFIGTCNKMP